MKSDFLSVNMLRLHRLKDRAKLALIAESHGDCYNEDVLKAILDRYGLWEKWHREYNADASD